MSSVADLECRLCEKPLGNEHAIIDDEGWHMKCRTSYEEAQRRYHCSMTSFDDVVILLLQARLALQISEEKYDKLSKHRDKIIEQRDKAMALVKRWRKIDV